MSSDQDRIERLYEHIGIEAYPRLKLLCEHFAKELKCNVYVYGSAMRTKDWRDIDLCLEFEYQRWNQISGALWGADAFSIASSALSMYASAIVGLFVEVHISTQTPIQTPNLLLGKMPTS